MRTYFLKLVLRGVTPLVWRRLRVPELTSLACLHHAIQILYSWDDDHLHRFHIHGKDYGISYEGGIFFTDNADEVFLKQFCFEEGDKFYYEYNFFRSFIIDIRLEKMREDLPCEPLFCTKGQGMPDVSKSDEQEALLAVLKGLARLKRKETTIEEVKEHFESFRRFVFNKNQANKTLSFFVRLRSLQSRENEP